MFDWFLGNATMIYPMPPSCQFLKQLGRNRLLGLSTQFVTSGLNNFVFITHYYGCKVLNRLASYVIQDYPLLP